MGEVEQELIESSSDFTSQGLYELLTSLFYMTIDEVPWEESLRLQIKDAGYLQLFLTVGSREPSTKQDCLRYRIPGFGGHLVRFAWLHARAGACICSLRP